MSVTFVDRWSTQVASNYTAGSTSLLVSVAPPGVSGACYFYLLIQAEGANTEEIFLVTNVSGTTLTVAGAKANTSASNHAATATLIGGVLTADFLTQLVAGSVGGFLGIPGLVKPKSADFSWFNQGSGSMTDLSYGVQLASTATSGNIVAAVKALPSSHYFVEGGFLVQEFSDSSSDWGVVIEKDTTHWYYLRAFQTDDIQLQYMTGLNSFTTNRWDLTGSGGFGTPYPKQWVWFFRFENDGSHYKVKISWDYKQSWQTMFSTLAVGTDFSGEVGIGWGMRFGNVNNRVLLIHFDSGAI